VTGRFDLYGFIGAGLGLLVGMIGHELAHAWTAVRLGDQSAQFSRKLTLDPRAHVDPIGTLVLPAIFLFAILFNANLGFVFGYAKPIPTRTERLRKPKRDGIIVALAGPAFNLLVVGLGGLVFRSVGALKLETVFLGIVYVNAFLFVINLLPIPPLDGSKILARFLSPATAARFEGAGQYLILFLVALFLIFRGVLAHVTAAVYEPILGPKFIGSP
jgi:Zn-dependent protease